eukprot:10892126-Alexandrium_andersonii.AAC.1
MRRGMRVWPCDPAPRQTYSVRVVLRACSRFKPSGSSRDTCTTWHGGMVRWRFGHAQTLGSHTTDHRPRGAHH